ncbi:glycosyltransferase [Winogradskyella sp. 3972H.M.0a.05]|uniref:glycosyltransferase n=1 Tax=Winogradskyella sp. 3972H.M.0a.05 TaxID=2950277 RepID=UPI0033982BCE
MRILLVGEYSRLHNSLKEGLEELGHEVTIIGNGDGFKAYPVDIELNHSFNNYLSKKIRVFFYKFLFTDLASIEIYLKTLFLSKRLKNYDVVQLINESSIKCTPKYEIKFLKRLKKNNKSLFLLSCGVDYTCIKYMIEEKFRYSILTPYINDKSLYNTYRFMLQYLNDDYKKLHDYLYENVDGVIASDMDYHLPLLGNKKYLGLAPNPINLDKLAYIAPDITKKIKIFHGVNTEASFKKGNNVFSDALKIIEQKYSDKVDIITTYSVPYNEYIEKYNSCHILLDQVYSYDQGFNALEAMAKGKVVFTGAEKEWLEYYNLEEDTVAINAVPSAESIANKLEWLILNPDKILEISRNARNFIEKEHHYLSCTERYVSYWKSAKH